MCYNPAVYLYIVPRAGHNIPAYCPLAKQDSGGSSALRASWTSSVPRLCQYVYMCCLLVQPRVTPALHFWTLSVPVFGLCLSCCYSPVPLPRACMADGPKIAVKSTIPFIVTGYHMSYEQDKNLLTHQTKATELPSLYGVLFPLFLLVFSNRSLPISPVKRYFNPPAKSRLGAFLTTSGPSTSCPPSLWTGPKV